MYYPILKNEEIRQMKVVGFHSKSLSYICCGNIEGNLYRSSNVELATVGNVDILKNHQGIEMQ